MISQVNMPAKRASVDIHGNLYFRWNVFRKLQSIFHLFVHRKSPESEECDALRAQTSDEMKQFCPFNLARPASYDPHFFSWAAVKIKSLYLIGKLLE